MQWYDMKPYHKGRDFDGNDVFSIPLPLDEDGMVGRECPREECQPRYFKIALGRESSDSAESSPSTKSEGTESTILHCPYCGHSNDLQEYTTKEQIEWVKSMMLRDIHRAIQDMFKSSIRSTHSTIGKEMFSIRLTYKPGRLPSVRHYAEKELKHTVECEQCGGKYAVYGISAYCPWCGEGNLHQHLQNSIAIIQSLLGMKSNVEAKFGSEVGYHLLGNCLEDCIGLFEGFMKAIYGHALRFVVMDDVRQEKLAQLRNSFQNLLRAESIIKSDLGWELFDEVEQPDRDFMEIEFAKRHVITHNLGLVDDKYLAQAQSWQKSGQDIVLSVEEIQRLLTILESMLITLIRKLFDLSRSARPQNS